MKKIITGLMLSLSMSISAQAEVACFISMNAKMGEIVAQQLGLLW